MSTVKTKWIELTLNISIGELSNLLLPYEYDDTEGYGFDVSEIRESSFDAQYVEKNTYNETVTTPDGDEKIITFDRYTSFSFTVFNFTKSTSFIKIENSPASLKKFISRLSEITSRKLFVINSSLDIENLSKLIENISGIKSFRVKKIAISNIQITKSGVSKIEIISEENAMEDFLKTFKQKKYKLNRMKMLLTIGGLTGNIELARTGMIIIDDNIYYAIEDELPELVMKSF